MENSETEEQTPSEDSAPKTIEPKPHCLNCDKKMPRKAFFCPHCGQRNNKGMVTFRELMQRFWANFSHLDSKFVRMCWQLFIPGKVTQEYFRGRQKRYPNPVQFFFVAMFFFLWITNALLKDTEERVLKTDPYDFKLMRGKIELSEQVSAKLDTLNTLFQQAKIDSVQLDSIFKQVDFQRIFPITNDSINSASFPGGPEFTIKFWDWYMLPADSIIQKYQYHSWMEKRVLRQAQKSQEFKTGMLKFYISTLAFSTLFLVALYAGVLYFFYRKQGRYYVEHFVYLLHVTTALMLFITVLSAFTNYCIQSPTAWNLSIAVIMLLWYTFFAQRNYYGESFRRTFWKWLIGSSIAIGLFIGIFMVGMILSFFFF